MSETTGSYGYLDPVMDLVPKQITKNECAYCTGEDQHQLDCVNRDLGDVHSSAICPCPCTPVGKRAARGKL